jgi:hypothetical protein
MSTPATKARRQNKSVMLAAGILLLFCVPQIQAQCGGHTYDFYTSSRDTEPFNTTVPAVESPGWASHVIHQVTALWKTLSASVPTFNCGRCPQDPTPGKRCEGPSCSGDSAPMALPVPSPTERSNEMGVFMGLGDMPRQDSSSSFTNGDCLFHLAAHLDSIFHPPRFS